MLDDDWYDRELDDQRPVDYFNEFNNADLVEMCRSATEPKIQSIRESFFQYGSLTMKQKWCLAYWCYYNLDD